MQLAAAAGAYVPAPHLSHELVLPYATLCAPRAVPAEHDAVVVMFLVVKYFPAATAIWQPSILDWPFVLLSVYPLGQFLQDVAADASWYVPAPHAVQLVAYVYDPSEP